ncbi:Glyoxalase/bleomycin resistance protein/dioxygenase [Paenibacillus mucilaginosus 3016]|uniref:Glyoxalase/bleomycin resistance protein/dioxygenase n=2 Tax=Paenibacillus mucilaginosus TaxID=61624 RepID=H6NPY4_9BACL|nr:VOC family protein [Paenibacillus mucilaginosus]AFC31175.1 Glyoxalase/bleomycin resistance protein/dioxygenase [Paenibacillus mucilaginosus 3016]AFH63496.1 glyoxalase [Paenibacillus mucilaginosus K02]WFA19751.1 VOC family protein [Paenibacillus mucilaginosus]
MNSKNHGVAGSALKAVCSVYIPVRSPLDSAAWWQRHFGLEYAVPFNPAESQVILKLSDGQWLHLVETEGPIDNQFPNKAGEAMFRMTFEVRRIEVLYERLQSSGVQTEGPEDRGSCGINFVFYDPDGNKFDVNECVRVHRTPEETERLRSRLFQPVTS